VPLLAYFDPLVTRLVTRALISVRSLWLCFFWFSCSEHTGDNLVRVRSSSNAAHRAGFQESSEKEFGRLEFLNGFQFALTRSAFWRLSGITIGADEDCTRSRMQATGFRRQMIVDSEARLLDLSDWKSTLLSRQCSGNRPAPRCRSFARAPDGSFMVSSKQSTICVILLLLLSVLCPYQCHPG